MKKIIFVLFVSCLICQASQAIGKKYLVDFNSQDIGQVRCYFNLDFTDGRLTGGTIEDAWKENYPFGDRLLINWFAGMDDNRLISLKGIYEEDGDTLDFRTAFLSPMGNYHFDGFISNGKISGKLFTADSISKGTIEGVEIQTQSFKPVMDYSKLTTDFCSEFESQFFDPSFFSTSDYKKFKKKLTKYSSRAIDDVHFVFSVFYYSRKLPYSHIGLWRNTDDSEKDEKPEEETEEEDEILSFEIRENSAILTIESFEFEPGRLTEMLAEIEKENPKQLIIDLRDNPGGSIGPAIELAEQIISEPVNGGYFLTRSYFENKKTDLENCHTFSEGDIDELYAAIEENECIEVKVFPKKGFPKMPIYILVNGNTASTCEPIVYGLKDEPKITVIGETTAGKMLSAKEFELLEGYVLFVPIADYVTPSRERLDQKGVEPEVVLEDGVDALEYALKMIRS